MAYHFHQVLVLWLKGITFKRPLPPPCFSWPYAYLLLSFYKGIIFFCVMLIKAATRVPRSSPLPSLAAWDSDSGSSDTGDAAGQWWREKTLLPW